ncbi:MAG: hypothetical protein A2Y81_09315 [Nitrospirae bacterium RBG_13_43_8]|nr:MAG: hypothetical protein A2Y81_09315 [Nitrospirae bacterium RBG_13_43_8]
MKKSLLEIYALAVSFATIVCLVISLGVAIYSIIEIINPEFTMNSYEYKRYQSNDAYWLSRVDDYRNKEKEMLRPSEDELTKQRTEGYRLAVISEKRDGYQGLTKTGIIILINILVFFIHWRIARRARETNIAT